MGYKPDFSEDIEQYSINQMTQNSSLNNLTYDDEERDHHFRKMTSIARAEKDKSWTKTRCYTKLPDFYEILDFGPGDRDESDFDSIFKPLSWQNQESRFRERNIISGKFLRLIGTDFLEGGKGKRSKNFLYIEMGEKVVFTSEILSNGSVKDTRFDIEPNEKLEELSIVLRRERQGIDRAQNRGISKFENGAILEEEMVKWYRGKIEMRKYRLGIVELDRLILRRVSGMGSEGVMSSDVDEDMFQNEIFELDVSILLQFKNQILLEDFKEIMPAHTLML